MQPPVIRSATNADRRAVVDALTLAFADDPFNRWYLPLIGVDPKGQGKGAGAALMKHATDAIDVQCALSYLESSTLKNISLYQRHGFDVMEHLPFGNDDGIATPMLRVRQS